ncbi:MAG: glycosyltransferase, partial [Verrucomicrobiae bacterium]|nr:glycosyltransferase [Verrucomicrobiae bacterium]
MVNASRPKELGPLAILYPTCNDFSETAVESLVSQTGVDATLFLLDDSIDPRFQARVDSWAMGKSGAVEVVRRSDREGFKAGNLNHWLAKRGSRGEFHYILLVDADEVIPPDFSRRLLDVLEAS